MSRGDRSSTRIRAAAARDCPRIRKKSRERGQANHRAGASRMRLVPDDGGAEIESGHGTAARAGAEMQLPDTARGRRRERSGHARAVCPLFRPRHTLAQLLAARGLAGLCRPETPWHFVRFCSSGAPDENGDSRARSATPTLEPEALGTRTGGDEGKGSRRWARGDGGARADGGNPGVQRAAAARTGARAAGEQGGFVGVRPLSPAGALRPRTLE
jgi:hypothetical protein